MSKSRVHHEGSTTCGINRLKKVFEITFNTLSSILHESTIYNMSADIRSFFGGTNATPIRQKEKETKKEEDSKKKRGSEFLGTIATIE